MEPPTPTETAARVAETRRLFQINRPARLQRKIRYLRRAGWHHQADSLATELVVLAGGTSKTAPGTPPTPTRGRDGA